MSRPHQPIPCSLTSNGPSLHADADRLAALLADEFLSIGERGFQLDKRQWIGRHREFRYLAIETTEVDVRRYDRAAIVRCVQRSRASWRGQPMTLAVRLSQVWTRQADGWRLAGIQFSTRKVHLEETTLKAVRKKSEG